MTAPIRHIFSLLKLSRRRYIKVNGLPQLRSFNGYCQGRVGLMDSRKEVKALDSVYDARTNVETDLDT